MIKKTKDAYSRTKKTNSRTGKQLNRRQGTQITMGSKLTPGGAYGRKHASVQVKMNAINRKRVHQGLEPLRSRPGSEHEAVTSSLRVGLGR